MPPQWQILIAAAIIIIGRLLMPKTIDFAKDTRERYERYRPDIIHASFSMRVPTYVLFRVALIESRFRPDARGASGELGMFQIMPANISRYYGFSFWIESDVMSVGENSLIAAWILRSELDAFDGNIEKAVRAYNVGRSNVGSSAADRYWDLFVAAGEHFPV